AWASGPCPILWTPVAPRPSCPVLTYDSPMNFWKFIGQHPQFLVVLLAFALPTIGRILKKLGEQAQKREQGLKRERDELERLRTGRTEPTHTQPAPEAPSARATLEEMAAKRRAQI